MDEGSDPKAPRRKRVSRACDRCRSKKDKCDGLRPSCSACLASGHTCSYDPHAKKRGLPEGYVRGLEKLWALAICNIDGFENAMLSLLGTTAESAGRRKRLMSLWMDDGASETLHESWKTCRLYNALERMLSPNSGSTSPYSTGKRPRDEDRHFSNDTGSEWGFRIDRSSTPLSQDAPRVIDPTPLAKRPRLYIPGESRQSPTTCSMHALQLPPRTSELLETYFAATHSWLPILAKHNILRASCLYANVPSISVGRLSPGSGDHAALWALLSYTVSLLPSDPQDGSLGFLRKAKEYYAVARDLIPSETEHYELGHVQALLLLTLVNIGLEDWTAAWILTGQAVRMVISMSTFSISDARKSDEMRQAKAVFLGCFIIDSFVSFRMSRRPSMHPRDLIAVGLLEEDGLEEWNSWPDVLLQTGGSQGKNPPRRGPLLALSCFNRLVELASVLNKITRDSVVGVNTHLSAQRLVSELKQWDDHLPLGCRLIGPESIYPERHSALLPHQTYLGLTYIAILLLLYLRIAPLELGSHRSQRPATEGAKKLLYRALPMISQHLDTFKICNIPPIFELSLRTIAEQAFTLRHHVESNSFPFGRWTEALVQRTAELSATWPVYRTLTTDLEQWYRSKDFSKSPAHSFSQDADNIPAIGMNKRLNLYYNPSQDSILSTTATEHRGLSGDPSSQSHTRRNPPEIADSDYASSIMGITIPVDTQYMTLKGTVRETADISNPPQGSTPTHTDRALPSMLHSSDPASDLDAMLLPTSQHLHPPTPDSSLSNPMISATSTSATTNDNPTTLDESPIHLPSTSSDTQLQENNNTSSLDAIFNDLAYLDTTEWATSREAGLKDFGFLDDTTFQAFCHDPDRLAGSQPLVHPPSIVDIWPPPGFFPETFQDPAEEAMES